jgi:hypothetical protein
MLDGKVSSVLTSRADIAALAGTGRGDRPPTRDITSEARPVNPLRTPELAAALNVV